MPNDIESERLAIAFPSLIRRVGGESAKELKAIALSNRCELKRIRRSRNWQLIGEVSDLERLSHSLQIKELALKHGFVVDKLTEILRPFQTATLPKRLEKLVLDDPSITLADLMLKTGCTIAQARLARDSVEF